MGDEGQPSAVAERGSFVVIGYLLWQLSRTLAVWPAEIRAKAALCPLHGPRVALYGGIESPPGGLSNAPIK